MIKGSFRLGWGFGERERGIIIMGHQSFSLALMFCSKEAFLRELKERIEKEKM